MKAEDTVMSRERAEGTIGYFMSSPKILDGIMEVAEYQAEVSFKAGIKEVVEWIRAHDRDFYSSKEEWKSKLKEWRIE